MYYVGTFNPTKGCFQGRCRAFASPRAPQLAALVDQRPKAGRSLTLLKPDRTVFEPSMPAPFTLSNVKTKLVVTTHFTRRRYFSYSLSAALSQCDKLIVDMSTKT